MSRTSNTDESNTGMVNRHPVHDARLKSVGYQTLAHTRVIGRKPDQDLDPASSTDTIQLLADHLGVLAGDNWGMVTLPWQAIVARGHEVLPKERVVVGIEEGPNDQRLFEAIASLSRQGYRVALPLDSESLFPVRHFADILKLDLSQCDDAVGIPHLDPSRERKASLLISGIKTHEDFDRCKAMGFDYFEGYFFCTPKKMAPVPATRSAAVRTLAALQNPAITLRELEDIIRFDVTLSYRLLNFINSAAVGINRSVSSIKHAVNLAGLERIRRWASVLLFGSMEKPRELVVMAAARARMCELLGDSEEEDRQAAYFTIGLLSVLDALLDKPMAEAIEGLSLSQELCDGLIQLSGPLGTTLRAVIAYERNDWERHALMRFRPSKLQDSYLNSLEFANTVASNL